MPGWSPTPIVQDVTALYASGRMGLASLRDGQVARSHDGGATWGVLPGGPAPHTLLAPAGGDVVAAGPAGLVRIPPHGGMSAAGPLPAGLPVLALAGAGNALLAASAGGGLFRRADDHAAWAPAGAGLPYAGDRLVVTALLASGDTLYAVHALGVHCSDAGSGWRAAGFGLPADVRGGSATLAGTTLTIALGDAVYRLAADLWTASGPAPTGTTRLCAAAGALVALTETGGVFASGADAGPWQDIGGGLPGPAIAVAAGDGWGMAAVEGRGLWRRDLAAPRWRRPDVVVTHAPTVLTAAGAELCFTLTLSGRVHLTLLDASGREAARLAEGRFASGAHSLHIRPGALAAGLYRWLLAAEGSCVSRGVVVLPDVA